MIGERLGHYDIVAKLGAGGMGEVYVARDRELDRRVALKVLPDRLAADPDRLERFRREARSLAAVNHPNIVAVYSVESEDGIHFMTMELVEGETLDAVIRDGGLTLDRIFEIALPLADALAEAHDRGIVHRDLKPSNIMLGEGGRLKVLDFGLAKGVAQDAAAASSQVATEALTAEGTIVGTVPYMSPEQLEARPLDVRSDIFSLGVILYEVATGARPFQGETSVSLMSAILKDEPGNVTELRAELPRHLGRIIRQCLEKNPDDRFQTARDVYNQMRGLRRETTTAESALPAAAAVTSSAGGRRRLGFALAFLLVLLAGYGAWRILAPRPDTPAELARAGSAPATSQPRIVVLPFENLGRPADEYFADGMTEEVITRLAGLDDLAVISRSTAMEYKGHRPDTAELGEQLDVDFILEGTVRWQKEADGTSRVRVTPELVRVSDDTHVWAERYDAVLADIFEVQSDIAEQVMQRLGVALQDPDRRQIVARLTASMEAYDYFLKGNEYLNRGREIHDGQAVELAIRMYDQALALDPAFTLAHARTALAHAWIAAESFDTSAERVERARRSADRALALDGDSAEARLASGFAHFAAGEHLAALDEFERARSLQPGRAEIVEAIAYAQTELGYWEESLATLQRAIELDPRSGRLRCWAGGHCFALRRFDQATRYHDESIQRTPDRACPYACQAWIAMNRENGTTHARQVLDALPPTLGLEEFPPLAFPWVTLEMMDGHYQAALDWLASGEKPVYEFRLFYVPKDLLAAQIYGLMGNPERRREQYLAALEHLVAAADATPDDARVRSSLAIALAGVGRDAEAIRQAELALELVGAKRDEVYGYRIKDLAQTRLMVGDIDGALDAIETLVSVPSFFSTHFIEADPTFDALHGHPRFEQILERYRPVEGFRPAHA